MVKDSKTAQIISGLENLAIAIDSVFLLEGNPRRGDISAVALSLGQFGQRKPIVVRKSDRQIIAGNHTWQAAKSLGWSEIAAVFVDEDFATSSAFSLADNRTSDFAKYDDLALAELLAELVAAGDSSLVDAAGYSPQDLDALLDRLPDFDPTEIVPHLDELLDKSVTCPHCGESFKP
jgi:hypothetical protein